MNHVLTHAASPGKGCRAQEHGTILESPPGNGAPVRPFFEGWRLPEEWSETRDWEYEETEKEVVMRMELPGFEVSEIELRAEGNEVVVRAVHPERKEGNGHRHAERHEWRFTMPFGTNADGITANYRNGVLELHLPRLPEAQPKRIEVKT